jgi:hypothetical protein
MGGIGKVCGGADERLVYDPTATRVVVFTTGVVVPGNIRFGHNGEFLPLAIFDLHT